MNIEQIKQKIGKPAIMKKAYFYALKVFEKVRA